MNTKVFLAGKKKTIFFGIAIAIFSSLATLCGLAAILGLDIPQLAQLSRFMATLRFVQLRYVDEVNDEALINGAISGLMKSLDDPYSLYLDPKMYKRMQDQTSGQFGGIGVVMGFDDGGVHVISVIPGTPSEAAGLRPADRIVAVNGESTADMPPENVAVTIRGEAGTEVILTIDRTGEERRDYTLTRDNIHVDTAAGKMLTDTGIGYIRISAFASETATEFQKTYDELAAAGMKGLILDLRANPGGYITTCVEIAQRLVPKGPIVSVVQRDGTREEHASRLESPPYPLVVLIDKNSASASEILAGALQDTHAATLVGTTSYGKGSVQLVQPIPGEKDAIKLTIAKYYTPNGRSINGVGIEPDVAVELPKDATEDLQLKAAMNVMREKLGLSLETAAAPAPSPTAVPETDAPAVVPAMEPPTAPVMEPPAPEPAAVPATPAPAQ